MGAQLAVVGGGRMSDEVDAWARNNPTTRTFRGVIPRTDVLALLRRTSVLVVPSQRYGRWREQIGESIQEALSEGCTVVTTDETGIAPWLAGRGHSVIPAASTSSKLPRALADALTTPLPVDAVLDSLPDIDGRLLSDGWLHEAEWSSRTTAAPSPNCYRRDDL